MPGVQSVEVWGQVRYLGQARRVHILSAFYCFFSRPGYLKFNHLTNNYWVPSVGPVLDTGYGVVSKHKLESYWGIKRASEKRNNVSYPGWSGMVSLKRLDFSWDLKMRRRENPGIRNAGKGKSICKPLRQERAWHIFAVRISFHITGHTHGKMFDSDDSRSLGGPGNGQH